MKHHLTMPSALGPVFPLNHCMGNQVRNTHTHTQHHAPQVGNRISDACVCVFGCKARAHACVRVCVCVCGGGDTAPRLGTPEALCDPLLSAGASDCVRGGPLGPSTKQVPPACQYISTKRHLMWRDYQPAIWERHQAPDGWDQDKLQHKQALMLMRRQISRYLRAGGGRIAAGGRCVCV